jgi:hypothetical protein
MTYCSRMMLGGILVGAACLAGPVAGAAAQVTITAGPPALTNDATPAFEFTGGTGFECGLAGPGTVFAPCTSPTELGPLADGAYVFEVRTLAPDPLSSDVHAFTVDTTAPVTTIASGPPALSNDATPEIAFSAGEAATFQCRLAGVEADFAACASPKGFGPLPDGSYVVEVRAVDAAGNLGTAATRSFEIDTTPPQTTITGGPGDTSDAAAVFLFSAPGAASTSCRLDGGVWELCHSPKVYSGLSLGAHRFEVASVDAAGNSDPSPAAHAWQVLRPGLVIPGTARLATALAKELVQIRRALSKLRLRRLARRRTIVFGTFDALTAGKVAIRARARVRQGGRPRWIGTLKGRREVPGAGRHRVRATVTKKGRRLAGRRRQLPLELRLSFTDLAGRSLWASSNLTLKR